SRVSHRLAAACIRSPYTRSQKASGCELELKPRAAVPRSACNRARNSSNGSTEDLRLVHTVWAVRCAPTKRYASDAKWGRKSATAPPAKVSAGCGELGSAKPPG